MVPGLLRPSWRLKARSLGNMLAVQSPIAFLLVSLLCVDQQQQGHAVDVSSGEQRQEYLFFHFFCLSSYVVILIYCSFKMRRCYNMTLIQSIINQSICHWNLWCKLTFSNNCINSKNTIEMVLRLQGFSVIETWTFFPIKWKRTFFNRILPPSLVRQPFWIPDQKV